MCYLSSSRTNTTDPCPLPRQQMMPKPVLFLTGFATKDLIGKEVHVNGWGNAFFTVRDVVNDHAWLSTRYNKRIKYQIPLSRCYFTRSCQTIMEKLHERRRKTQDEGMS